MTTAIPFVDMDATGLVTLPKLPADYIANAELEAKHVQESGTRVSISKMENCRRLKCTPTTPKPQQ